MRYSIPLICPVWPVVCRKIESRGARGVQGGGTALLVRRGRRFKGAARGTAPEDAAGKTITCGCVRGWSCRSGIWSEVCRVGMVTGVGLLRGHAPCESAPSQPCAFRQGQVKALRQEWETASPMLVIWPAECCERVGGDSAGVGPAVWHGGAVSGERVVAAGGPGPFRVW